MTSHLELAAPPEPPPDPLLGQTIDSRYLIERRVGEGGMGVVYLCKHVILGKPLAMKVLRGDVSRDEEIIARFRQEAQSASAIGSQHIIEISDFGTLADGSAYFVMEYLDGRELTGVIEGADGITPERVIHIAKQLCDALGAAHDRGIVHRDMKPDNVFLLERPNNPDFVKVLDFGIAKVGGANSKLTKAGQVFGTPHYMSPEQCAGQAVDNRTDIYAVGVIMYEMACGRVPFDADNLMGILTKHIYENPIPPHELPPPVDVPPGLEAVILKALAKQPDQRYQTMAEMKADLDLVVAGQTPGAVMDAVDRTAAPGIPDPTGHHSLLEVGVGGEHPDAGSKLPMILGAVVGLVLLLATAAVVYFVVLTPDEPEPIAVEDPVGQVAPDPVVEEPVVEEPVVEEPVVEEPVVVMLSITSDPPGVEVWVSDEPSGDTLAGNTPYEVERPERGQFLSLILKQTGYRDHLIRVGHFTQRTVNVTLRRSRASGRRSGRRSGGSGSSGGAEPQETAPQEPPQETTRRRTGIGSEVLDPWSH